MTFYDIFNGDADGVCALHQLRLSEPRESILVTGVKREIRLLERVSPEPGDELTVLDISLRENREALDRCLAAGARCRYFDHHFAGEVPAHPGLEAHIDTGAEACTSLIVDRYLEGRHRAWAVVAAFGDNLFDTAWRLGESMDLAPPALDQLARLGECLNYNAYGETVDDLYYHPADLFQIVGLYHDPLHFISDEPVLDVLAQGFGDDLARAGDVEPLCASERYAVYVLPEEAWARRVSGTLGNRLARGHPQRAHAVLVKRGDGYVVSVRAPQAHPVGADELCRRFPEGGGRRGAAGINHLPEQQLEAFVREFRASYGA
ncbi:MAG: acetyltransferase [Betaproteobacteria bacterium]|nr:acetyltransferase [Betaproteobacteria bacterium]